MMIGGFEVMWLALALLGVGIFLWLQSRERKRAEKGQSRLAGWRLALGTVAALVMVFSGGCSLLFLPDAIKGTQYIDPLAVLIVGGIPFALALLFFWLIMKRWNAEKPDKAE